MRTAARRAFLGLLLPLVALGLDVSGSLLAPATADDYAPQSGITMSPTYKNVTISSGLLEAHNTITLTNHSGLDLAATLRAADLSELNAEGNISFGQAGKPLSKYGLAKWMVLPDGDNVALPKGQTVNVPVNIENRADLAPGGHYGAVVVAVTPAGAAAASNKVQFKQQLASFFIVTKEGGLNFGLKLISFTADEQKSIPGSVSLKFESTGNVHVVPRGYVTVQDPAGKVVAKGFINQESTLVLPGASRVYQTTLTQVAKSKLPGRYKVTAYYRHDGQKGYSTAVLYMGNGTSIIRLVTGVILVILAALAAYFWRFRRGRPRYRP